MNFIAHYPTPRDAPEGFHNSINVPTQFEPAPWRYNNAHILPTMYPAVNNPSFRSDINSYTTMYFSSSNPYSVRSTSCCGGGIQDAQVDDPNYLSDKENIAPCKKRNPKTVDGGTEDEEEVGTTDDVGDRSGTLSPPLPTRKKGGHRQREMPLKSINVDYDRDTECSLAESAMKNPDHRNDSSRTVNSADSPGVSESEYRSNPDVCKESSKKRSSEFETNVKKLLLMLGKPDMELGPTTLSLLKGLEEERQLRTLECEFLGTS